MRASSRRTGTSRWCARKQGCTTTRRARSRPRGEQALADSWQLIMLRLKSQKLQLRSRSRCRRLTERIEVISRSEHTAHRISQLPRCVSPLVCDARIACTHSSHERPSCLLPPPCSPLVAPCRVSFSWARDRGELVTDDAHPLGSRSSCSTLSAAADAGYQLS